MSPKYILSHLIIILSFIIRYAVAAVTRQSQDIRIKEKQNAKIIAFALLILTVIALIITCILGIRRKLRRARHRAIYDDTATVNSMQTDYNYSASVRLESITSSLRSSITFCASMIGGVAELTTDTPPTRPSPTVTRQNTSVINRSLPYRSIRRNHQNRCSNTVITYSPSEFNWDCQDNFETEPPPPYKPV